MVFCTFARFRHAFWALCFSGGFKLPPRLLLPPLVGLLAVPLPPRCKSRR
jgi:hypothetical protein